MTDGVNETSDTYTMFTQLLRSLYWKRKINFSDFEDITRILGCMIETEIHRNLHSY
jgi:hypothetical protein